MSASEVETITLKTKINDSEITIKKSLTWGELRAIAKASYVSGQFVPLNALDQILEKVVVSGFEPKDRTALMKQDAGVITAIIGEVLSIIPLEKYMDNLNIDKLTGEMPVT